MIEYNQKICIMLVSGVAILFANSIYAQTESSVSAPPSPAPVVEDNSKIISSYSSEFGIKSLLFSDGDIAAIRNARLFYEQHRVVAVNGGIAEDDFLKNIEKLTTAKFDASSNLFTYPQFFLSSIAYYSPDDWVLWINDEKITKDSGVSLAGLRVVQIDNEKALIEWHPERMDKIIDHDLSENDVDVDFMQNKVTFLLKANQTFTSYAMRVVEGKVPPVTVNLDANMAQKTLVK